MLRNSALSGTWHVRLMLCSVVGEIVKMGENGREREHAKAIYLMRGKKTPNQLPHGPNIWPDGPEVLLSAVQGNVICSREFI